jgi:hypothetical protein
VKAIVAFFNETYPKTAKAFQNYFLLCLQKEFGKRYATVHYVGSLDIKQLEAFLATMGENIQVVIEERPELIGGIKVQHGDNIWDFSIQGQFRNGSRIEPLLISSNGLEDITLGFLSVYEKILTCFAENKLIDYSVLCSLTHKIFESELNASILQLMRLYKKIPMPECYKKWYATKEKYGVLNGTFFINLNDHDKGHPKAYRSPGLGNMYYAFKVMSEDGEWNTLCSKFGLDKEHVNELMSHWENIFRVRNKEAHCTPISFSVYQDITKSVNKVFELCFNNIVMIKKHLR